MGKNNFIVGLFLFYTLICLFGAVLNVVNNNLPMVIMWGVLSIVFAIWIGFIVIPEVYRLKPFETYH